MSFFTGRTILITGSSSGIGLALAERLLAQGNEVIILGRRGELLASIKERLPAIHTHVADVSTADQRVALVEWATATHPNLDVVVNNAGIQRHVDLVAGSDSWAETQSEIAINLEAPIHLAQLFAPFLRTRPHAAIVNVTSGLSFVPIAVAPVYCATKAALHSFTLSLRHQLRDTSVRVIEIIPPAVNTDLGGTGKHTFGVPLDEYADGTVKGLNDGLIEVPYGFSAKTAHASRAELDAIFASLNTNVAVAVKSE